MRARRRSPVEVNGKRTFSMSIPGGGVEVEEFLDYLEKKLEGRDYSYRYTSPGRLSVTVYGTTEEMRKTEKTARNALRNFTMVRSGGRVRRYPRDWLNERVGGVGISLLVTALRGMGREVSWAGDVLRTDTTPEEMGELIESLRAVASVARLEVRQRRVREVLAAAAVISGRSFLDVMDEALEAGMIEEVDGIYLFRRSPESVLRELSGR